VAFPLLEPEYNLVFLLANKTNLSSAVSSVLCLLFARDAWVEALIIGLRGMMPYQMLPMQLPYAKIEKLARVRREERSGLRLGLGLKEDGQGEKRGAASSKQQAAGSMRLARTEALPTCINLFIYL
jgi:hypothetical protein